MVLLSKQTRDEKEYEYEHDEYHGDHDYEGVESEIGVTNPDYFKCLTREIVPCQPT